MVANHAIYIVHIKTMRGPEMTKADLADILNERFSYNQKEAFALVDNVLEVLKEAIATEGHVKISGFRNFTVRQKADRNGRNPQTGETITISSRKVLTFKPSVILKNRINQE
jgi:integration host factor subunit alpha